MSAEPDRTLREWIDWIHDLQAEQDELAEAMRNGLLAIEQATLAALAKAQGKPLPLCPPEAPDDSLICVVGPWCISILGGPKRPRIGFEKLPQLPEATPCEPLSPEPPPF